MRSTLLIVGCLLAVALPAHAGPRASASALTIRVTATADGGTFIVDRAPKGLPSKADVLREPSILRNAVTQFGRPKGAVVGRDVWIVKIVVPLVTRFDVKATATLPGGKIYAAGILSGAHATGTLRVTGGTGRYGRARGTVSLRDLNQSGSRGLNVYRLTLP